MERNRHKFIFEHGDGFPKSFICKRQSRCAGRFATLSPKRIKLTVKDDDLQTLLELGLVELQTTAGITETGLAALD